MVNGSNSSDSREASAGGAIQVADLIATAKDYPRRWLVPVVALTLVALAYAVLRNPTWEATQALYVRDEATATDRRPGSFNDLEEMKTVQETILELSRTDGVLTEALATVGPPADFEAQKPWPTPKAVAALRDRLSMSPPHGAEFGKTEVFYLHIEDKDRRRAVALVAAVCDGLERRFRDLRQEKAQSMIAELERTETLAEADLRRATQQLAMLESSVGVDLGELRMLHASTSANSDLRQKINEVENEIRGYETEQRRDEQLLVLLRQSQDDPGRLLASPNSLLASQPALRRLKEGLIDAQLRTSQLRGSMSADHPLVISAATGEQEIGQNLHGELEIAVRGLEVELAMTADRLEALRQQRTDLNARLERLAELRARYATLVATTENRTSLLETARANTADARASRAASTSVSLLSRIDLPDAGIYPKGPGKKVIVLAGMFGGLLIGLGVVFVTAVPRRSTTAMARNGGNSDSDHDSIGVTAVFSGLNLKRTLHRLQNWAEPN